MKFLPTQAREYREIHALEIVFCEREYPGRHSPLVQKSFSICLSIIPLSPPPLSSLPLSSLSHSLFFVSVSVWSPLFVWPSPGHLCVSLLHHSVCSSFILEQIIGLAGQCSPRTPKVLGSIPNLAVSMQFWFSLFLPLSLTALCLSLPVWSSSGHQQVTYVSPSFRMLQDAPWFQHTESRQASGAMGWQHISSLCTGNFIHGIYVNLC